MLRQTVTQLFQFDGDIARTEAITRKARANLTSVYRSPEIQIGLLPAMEGEL